MSDSEVREEIDYDSLSVEELFQNGKSLFKEKKYLESAEYFSRALERKSGEDPSHYSLRDYYLWYADSLLTNEEQSSNIFSSSVKEGHDDNLPSAQTVLDAAKQSETNQSDETLAFELFQFAHKSYMNYFKELETSNREPKEEDVLDASYCLVRLGDMFFSNHQFEEASSEYEKALHLREKHKLPVKQLVSVYISLAQSQMFNGKLKLSLETFNKSKELLKQMLTEDPTEEEKTNLENTLEDITIQSEDLKKLISESASMDTQNVKGSQSNAASLIPKTTSSLDQRQLDSNVVKSRVIDINVGDVVGKKRRIDLSKQQGDAQYKGNPYPVGIPHSLLAATMYEGSVRTFQSNPVSNDIMNHLLEEKRAEDYNSWMDDRVSKYTACSNIIANEISHLYNRDDLNFDDWQYLVLYNKFKKILTERGTCSPETITYLIYNLINMVKNDLTLRNLLMISSDEYVEEVLTKFVEMALNQRIYGYEYTRPNIDDFKMKSIRKHLQRSSVAASMANSVSKSWGWKDVENPYPIQAPSQLKPENYYVYGRQLRSNDENINIKDGCIPVPRVVYRQKDIKVNKKSPYSCETSYVDDSPYRCDSGYSFDNSLNGSLSNDNLNSRENGFSFDVNNSQEGSFISDNGTQPETEKKKSSSKRYGPRGPYKRTLIRMRMREISRMRRHIKNKANESFFLNSDFDKSVKNLKDDQSNENENDNENIDNINNNENISENSGISGNSENIDINEISDINVIIDNNNEINININKENEDSINEVNADNQINEINETNGIIDVNSNINNVHIDNNLKNDGIINNIDKNIDSQNEVSTININNDEIKKNVDTITNKSITIELKSVVPRRSNRKRVEKYKGYDYYDSVVKEKKVTKNGKNVEPIHIGEWTTHNGHNNMYSYYTNIQEGYLDPNLIYSSNASTNNSISSSPIANDYFDVQSTRFSSETASEDYNHTDISYGLSRPINVYDLPDKDFGLFEGPKRDLGLFNDVLECNLVYHPQNHDLLLCELNKCDSEVKPINKYTLDNPFHSKPVPNNINEKRRSNRLSKSRSNFKVIDDQLLKNDVIDIIEVNDINGNNEELIGIDNNENLLDKNSDNDCVNEDIEKSLYGIDNINKIDIINGIDDNSYINNIDDSDEVNNKFNIFISNMDNDNENVNNIINDNIYENKKGNEEDESLKNNDFKSQEKNFKRKDEYTIWDMVQKHHKSNHTYTPLFVKSMSNGFNNINLNDEGSEEKDDMSLLIREHYHISENVPSSQTLPFANAYKNPKCVKWSYSETKRFYNAIETFGTDLLLVRAFLPEFTDRQIYDKFKLEERKNPQLMQNALQTHKSISLKQYEQKHGKIDTKTHYNPHTDPLLQGEAITSKSGLQLNPDVTKQFNGDSQLKVDDKIINLFM